MVIQRSDVIYFFMIQLRVKHCPNMCFLPIAVIATARGGWGCPAKICEPRS